MIIYFLALFAEAKANRLLLLLLIFVGHTRIDH